MARTPAWDDQLELDSPFRRSQSGRWKTVLVCLGLVGVATFVLGYYLPLHRAHAALSEQHRVMSGKAQAAATSLKQVQAELGTTKDRRDELERERFQRESLEKSALSKLDILKASLATKLEKLTSKGQAAVTLADGRLFVSLPESLVFTPNKAEVTPRGKAVLCDIAKSTTQNALHVGSVAADASGAAPALEGDFKSVWVYSAARAGNVAQTLEQGCSVASSRLSAIGHGNVQPSLLPKTVADKFPARVDIEILP
jgi:chemotaxis protein MotB